MEGGTLASMYIRIIGAFFIIGGSGGVGITMAIQYMRSYKALKQLISALETMICEVRYRLSPLSVMCREAARCVDGGIRKLFLTFSQELEDQISPDAYQCMCSSIQKTEQLPSVVVNHLKRLGKSLGQFDLEGQIRMMESVREDCLKDLLNMDENKKYRIRSYQTLSLCAGAALAVLLC